MGMTESNRYRAGIIGLGFIGAADQVSGDALGQRVEDLGGTHLGALSNHPRVDLVAGSSRDPGRRERFAQRTQAAVFDDWGRMLEQQQLDIVSVATYADVHAEIVMGCVDAGVRAIYCEKPIAQTVNDAARMLEVCGWNKTRTAKLLGIDRKTLYAKLKLYGLEQSGT